VPSGELEQVLRDFDRIATRIEVHGADEEASETWRFEWNGRPFLLHFYERRRGIARLLRGNPAQRHFFGLQTLQKLEIPAPRAVAHLAGFRLGNRRGDAVIVESLEPGATLLQLLIDHDLRGKAICNRRALAEQVRSIVHRIGQAKLGHSRLTLDRFVVRDDRVLLIDGEHLHRGGMRLREVMRLGQSAARFATRGELHRAWEILQPGSSIPRENALRARERRFICAARRGEGEFTTLESNGWRGVFANRPTVPRRGSLASQLHIASADWERAWPQLLRLIQSSELTPLKRDASGEILTGEISLAGRTIPVVIKRPRNKFWYRYVLDAFRPSRAARTWTKTWKAIVRGVPTEWPLLLMEKRMLGYVTDAILVFERVEGTTLDKIELEAMTARDRETLFWRAGRSLRILERTGLAHIDPKSTNWIVQPDERRGPVLVMIDLFGIRRLTFGREAFGIRRLLRAMRNHPQYSPADSLALCKGFSPFSRIVPESTEDAALVSPLPPGAGEGQ
jgi:tRNA A-37 threonylcarbamoyl transferase component Bud32